MAHLCVQQRYIKIDSTEENWRLNEMHSHNLNWLNGHTAVTFLNVHRVNCQFDEILCA